jgi:hypothetical protein
VDTPLGGQEAEGVAPLHDERGRQQPGLLARGGLVHFDLEPPALGPPRVHPAHHLCPVLGVGPAGAGMDLGHRVELVMVAGEQRPELQGTEASIEVGQPGFDLRTLGLVVLFLQELVQRGRVGQHLSQAVELLEVLGHPTELGGHAAGVVGIVPEIGERRRRLELVAPGAQLLDAQVVLSHRQALGQLGQTGRDVDAIGLNPLTGVAGRGHSVGAVAELELLAAPAPARLVPSHLLVLRLHDRRLDLDPFGGSVGHAVGSGAVGSGLL